MEERLVNCDSRIQDMAIQLGKLEERLKAADAALEVSRQALEAYKVSSNEWRQALNDQRLNYVTRGELFSISGLIVAVTTGLVQMIRHWGG